MGYEIKILIGKSTNHPSLEIKRTTIPYADGSGFEPERDEKGSYVYTGNTEHWFQIYAMIDMCKLGYQSAPLNDLISESFSLAASKLSQIHFYYSDDGNTHIKEDRYGARMHPVPLKRLAETLNDLDDMEYRRLRWLKALVDEMAKDPEELQVMFFGY